LETTALAKGTRVTVLLFNVPGVIHNVREGEEFGGIIYTVKLDDQTFTPDGFYYARPGEVGVEPIIPAWMTPAQVEAIDKLYVRNPNGSQSRAEFFTKVQQCGIGSDRYGGINWCGMFLGIEPDGHTHS
jgi:hypothetical protein